MRILVIRFPQINVVTEQRLHLCSPIVLLWTSLKESLFMLPLTRV